MRDTGRAGPAATADGAPRMRALHWTTGPTALAIVLVALVGSGTAQTSTSTSTTSSTAAGSSTTTSSSSTTTTIPPALRCKNRLLNRATKLDRRLARCAILARKRAKKGRPFDQAACVAAALERYDRTTVGSAKFAKGCLECTRDGVTPVRDGLTALAADLDARIGCAPEIPIAERAKCEIRLHKAVAAYQARLMRCRRDASLAAFEGTTFDELQCVLDARVRFDTKAARLSCPPCVNPDRLGGTAFEDTDDLITIAHCPCRFGDAGECPECRTCSLTEGCVPADEGAACGRNGCTAQSCKAGVCETGDRVDCSDGDVCTVDTCIDGEGESCEGEACCVHEPLCDPATLPACVLECTCDPAFGCSCRCEAGCPYVGCVIFNP